LVVLAIAAMVVGGIGISGCCMPSSLSDKIGEKVGDSVKEGVEKSIENETGVTIDTDDSGETSGEDLKSAPRYPKSKRTFYIKGEPIDGDVSISITYESEDDTAKVTSWYKDKMPELGWKVQVSVGGTDGGEMITYERDAGETTVTVSTSKVDDKTSITLIYNGKEAGA
jgi:hypothetical protein